MNVRTITFSEKKAVCTANAACGKVAIRELLKEQKSAHPQSPSLYYPDHNYKHFINICGKCGDKANIFNKGEDIKLEIAQKQFNVLKGEDRDEECFYCPYKDLFRVALRWIEPEERRHILDITSGEELVQEMIDEIREDELEEEEFDNRTREPDDSPEARVLRDSENEDEITEDE